MEFDKIKRYRIKFHLCLVRSFPRTLSLLHTDGWFAFMSPSLKSNKLARYIYDVQEDRDMIRGLPEDGYSSGFPLVT